MSKLNHGELETYRTAIERELRIPRDKLAGAVPPRVTEALPAGTC